MLACFFCGAAYVPLSDSLPMARIAYILQDSGAKGVITCSETAAHDLLLESKEFTNAEIQPVIVPVLMLNDVSDLIWSSGPPQKDRTILKDLHKDLPPPPQPNDVAYVIYTSGTTGKPKGVEVEHHGMLNVLLAHVTMGSVSMEDLNQSVCVASFIFDSHVREVWMPLVWGGCTCIAKDVLHMTEGRMCAGTPTGLVATIASDGFPSSIRTVMAGGERLSKAVLQTLVHPNTSVEKVINAYGPTETVIECLTWTQTFDSDTSLPENGMPIGLPLLNVVAYGIKIAETYLHALLKMCISALAPRGTLCEL